MLALPLVRGATDILREMARLSDIAPPAAGDAEEGDAGAHASPSAAKPSA